MTVAVITDSSSQLPPERAEEAGIAIIPVTVLLGGEERLEGVDIDADTFYEHLAADGSATTSLPSPGRFDELYRDLLAGPTDEIVSVHVSGDVSGTLAAARVAARGKPVLVVDSRQASYGVAVCALAAARVVASGGSSDDAAREIDALSPRIGNAFVVGAPAGGRILVDAPDWQGRVLSFDRGSTTTIADTPPGTVGEALASAALAGRDAVAVAVGASDSGTFALADELEALLRESPQVVSVERYRVGASVGAHTGAGSYGVFWWPAAGIRSTA